MNILILNWRDPKNPKSGGAEIVTLEYARGWRKAGHKVVWLATAFQGAPRQEILDGIVIQRLGTVLTSFFLFPLFYFFSGNHFDIVVDEIHGLPFLTPLYVKKPIIGFIHEIAGEIWDSMYAFPISMIGKILERFFFFPYANISFITVSKSTKDDLIKMGVNEKRIHILHNGLSNQSAPLPLKKNDNHTFLFVSRLVKMKGIEDILRSYSSIYQQDPNSQLIIVGSGEKRYVAYLRRLAQDLGVASNVTFKGFISQKEKLSLMAKSHILLHASVKEGWGLVVIEAASQGTPAIVYNVAGLRDSVINNKTGIILAENSPKDMAQAALNLVNDTKRYKIFQKNCFAWAKSFSWSTNIKESLSILSKALNGI